MIKIILFIFLVILQALIAFLPTQGKISDNRSGFPKNLTKKGRFLFWTCITTIPITIILFFLTNFEEIEKKIEFENRLASRDSLNRVELNLRDSIYNTPHFSDR